VLLERKSQTLLPVPYDFDFAGLVNTPYAEPNPKLKIRNVRTRLYRGHCEVNEQLPQTLQRFRDNEPAIRELIAEQSGLDDNSKKDMNNFIDAFYKTINKPASVEKILLKKCS
jgi:hypothetical protein